MLLVVQFDLTMRVLAALEEAGVRYVVFGGVAVNLLGLARATEDLDLFVEPTADNIARLRRALDSVFDDPCIEEITAEDLLGEYPAIQYAPPSGGFHVDILTKLGEAFRFEELESLRLVVDGTEVSVATPRQLFRMKRDTVRDRDRIDAAALARAFDLESEAGS